MLIITKDQVREAYLPDLYAQIHTLKEKAAQFHNAHDSDLQAFEAKVNGANENFRDWDDYIEWKAIEHAIIEAENKVQELRSGNFKIA